MILAIAIADSGTRSAPTPSTPTAPAHVPSGVTTAAVTPGKPSAASQSSSTCSSSAASGSGSGVDAGDGNNGAEVGPPAC